MFDPISLSSLCARDPCGLCRVENKRIRSKHARLLCLLSVIAVSAAGAVGLRHCVGLPLQKLKIQPLRVTVVFFSVVNPNRDWRRFFDVQIGQLVSCGLASAASIEIILSSLEPKVTNDTVQMLHNARDHVRRIVPTASILIAGSNHFEYPGIQRVWQLAVSDVDPANHVILYLHGKSMVNHGDDGLARSQLNKHLMDTVVCPWRIVLRFFESDTSLAKAGYAVGEKGNMWFNFWWARSSYLVQLVEPVLTSDRYYYEHWLSFLRPDAVTRRQDVMHGYTGDGKSCQTVFPRAFGYSGPTNALSLCPGALDGATSFPEDLDLIMDRCKANISYDSTKQC